MAKNILIRCDASKEIGLGHITRCLVLANQFRDNGDNVIFAIKDYKLVQEKLNESSFEYVIASSENFDYFKWIEQIVIDNNINIFVGDIRDGFPVNLITFMKNKDILTIAIDEPSEYAKECDLCFYPPHANIDKSLYKGIIYQGLEYVLLRPEFYESYKKANNNIPNILLMLGGTDAKNKTLDLLMKLDKNKEKFNIEVVLSNENEKYDDVKKYIKSSFHKVKLHSKIKNMSSYLNNIDYAVIAFGTLAYELISKNIPSIYLSSEDLNEKAKNYFEKNKFGIFDKFELSNLLKLSFNKKIIKFNLVNKI